MKDDFQQYNWVCAEYFKKTQPCLNTAEINSLSTLIAIEPEVITTID